MDLDLKVVKNIFYCGKLPKKNEMILIKDPITNKIAIKRIFAIPGEKFKQIEKIKYAYMT